MDRKIAVGLSLLGILFLAGLLHPARVRPAAPAADFTPTCYEYLPLALKEYPATPTFTATPGPCECYADLYNCSDFSTQAQAQACHDHCVNEGMGDIHRLDQDNDGEACESLP